MSRSVLVVIILAGLVGGIVVTFASVGETYPDNLTCANERIVAYGWTSKRVSMAELAAIAKWQEIVKSKFSGFEQWHQAYKRTMSCRKFEDSSHFQCEVSATPCNLKKI